MNQTVVLHIFKSHFGMKKNHLVKTKKEFKFLVIQNIIVFYKHNLTHYVVLVNQNSFYLKLQFRDVTILAPSVL